LLGVDFLRSMRLDNLGSVHVLNWMDLLGMLG
jgi:hypothetical protein